VTTEVAASVTRDIKDLRRERDQLSATIEFLERAIESLEADSNGASPKTSPRPRATKRAAAPRRRGPAKATTTAARSRSITGRIEELLREDPDRTWSVADLVAALQAEHAVTSRNPEGAMRTTITRLHKEGRILRAERGRYRSVR